MSSETLTLSYGNSSIAFRLERRDRKTLAISVGPDAEVEVIAPTRAPIEKVLETVRKRARWIQRQQRFFVQFRPRTPQRQYVAGETHLYLGRQYRLKVALHMQQQVKLYRGRLVVQSHRPKDPDATRELVEGWYRDRARAKFQERLMICQERFPTPDTYEPVGLVIMQLRQRWGSMTPSHKLILNKALIQASVDAIDYVITHELCHMRHQHHGAAFFGLLNRVMPDWERRKKKLERQLA
ncbi:MAG TPA: SprT family zinc-dependent metalloprotease [Rhizomicrobium sp.]|nr:SprT family zinc-dependent metalloprotease [Rhizomicrobium sp.]